MYVYIHDPVHMYRARKMHVCDQHIYAYLPTNISVCIHSVSIRLVMISALIILSILALFIWNYPTQQLNPTPPWLEICFTCRLTFSNTGRFVPSFLVIICIIFYYIYLLCMCTCMCTTVWRLEGNLWGSVLSLYSVGPRSWSQLLRLGSKHCFFFFSFKVLGLKSCATPAWQATSAFISRAPALPLSFWYSLIVLSLATGSRTLSPDSVSFTL